MSVGIGALLGNMGPGSASPSSSATGQQGGDYFAGAAPITLEGMTVSGGMDRTTLLLLAGGAVVLGGLYLWGQR